MFEKIFGTFCNKSDNAIMLVTTTGNEQCEYNVSTTCEQFYNNLFADL
jgi:hypothetical protein